MHTADMARLFSFPNPVNEIAARTVAAGVVALCAATLITGSPWLLALLAYGFVARVLTGPTLSPWGQLVTRVIVPQLRRRFGWQPRFVPGPPKRFAQGIGATLSVSALALYWAGVPILSWVAVGGIAIAATLESGFGYCLGCVIFARLQSWGWIPASVCEACNDITPRLRAALAER